MAEALDNEKLKDLIVTGRVDWSDPSVDSTVFEKEYLVDWAWYTDHVPTKHKANPPSILTLERSFLRTFKCREDYKKPCKRTGLPWHVHFFRYIKALYPQAESYQKLVLSPFLIEAVLCIEKALKDEFDIVNTLGSKSSGKTFLLAYVGLAMVSIDPKNNIAFVAAPFKGSADQTVFGDMKNAFDHIKEAHPVMSKDWYPIGGEKPTELVLDTTNEKSGVCKLVGVDKVGKLKGTKQAYAEEGLFVVLIDELNEHQNEEFAGVIDNLTANDGCICITSCNYTGKGLDFPFCEPVDREYSHLNPDTDQIWYSAFNSITIRFDGYRNPNVLAKRDVYKFGLLKYRKFLSHMKAYGEGSTSYWSQIRSFPIIDETANFILTATEIRAAGSYDDFVFTRTVTRICLLDPAFGGKDNAMIGAWEFGNARIFMPSNTFIECDVLVPLITPIALDIKPLLTCESKHIEQIRELPRNKILASIGQPLPPNIQLVLLAFDFLSRHRIQISNFGYDSSMRGGLVSQMERGLGGNPTVYDFGEDPPDKDLGDGTNLLQAYANVTTAAHFCFQKIVTSSQYRQANYTEVGLRQICRRKWKKTGKKTIIESKDDYKAANTGKSPDDGDVCAMAGLKAIQLGFKIRESKSAEGNQRLVGMGLQSSNIPLPFVRNSIQRID